LNVSAPAQESAGARRLRLAACSVIAVLLAIIVRWVVMAPTTARLVAGAVLAVPLAVGLPFLYAGRRRAYAWMTLALSPSLVLGLTEAVANSAMRGWAATFVFVLLAAFVLFVAYLRATRSSSLP
jgi:uncharacterized membrane protein